MSMPISIAVGIQYSSNNFYLSVGSSVPPASVVTFSKKGFVVGVTPTKFLDY